MSTFQLNRSRIAGSKSSKDKSFSSKGKIEKYNQDGTETIIVMGRPFRVVQKIGGGDKHTTSYKDFGRKNLKDTHSYVVLVENVENLSEFPRHFVLKRSFFNVDEVLLAHRELEVLGRVKDKGIVKVFHTEITRSDGKLGVTVAMEYCSSDLYRRLCTDTRVPEGEIVQVLLAVTSVVGYLHSRQPPIAHRNITPENILIHSGSIGAASYRLCNFRSVMTEAYHCANREEVVMAVEDIERNTSGGFRAPEMADPGSGKRIDERVDLWSIGVLLYYMMYLRLPFGETNMGLTGRLKLRFPAGTEMWYTGSLRVVLTHLLEPDPEKRWDIFALTNFLRFDEDISKHIGTFFFTVTEWPDGWEQQDIKVVNRVAPPKAPPVRVHGGPPPTANVASAADTGMTDRTQTDEELELGSPMGDEGEFELDPEALAALGIDVDSADPEMRRYCKTLIQEQKEVWRAAKVAKAKKVRGSQPQETREEGYKGQGAEQPQQQKEEPPKEDKQNFFEDLFAPAPAPQPTSYSFPAAASQPTTSPDVVHDEKNWQDTLFHSAPASQQLPQQQQQQQLPPQTRNSFGVMDIGWGSGVPTTAPVAGYGVADVYTGPQLVTAAPLAMPQQPHQQYPSQQFSSPWEGNASSGPQAPPIQQQQQQPVVQQATMDVTKGGFPPRPSFEPNPAKKKDPFEDLFS
ncbi:putative protein kinase [Trypanosoma rangeli]|uniref:non-specific serine/threonine protein kinase n=1 Tax=Trypanosoma rangeli TaxID=5698 RepID=A0A422NRC0_TRYRA|nr:putative protein kinase [Trypanosoma rangeli]RNF08028.1 putative protein kinase [Trypanosoma rangeli]|eukprot:RNF08028.1 putative protein kinase [Trypanosoma rangeli]